MTSNPSSLRQGAEAKHQRIHQLDLADGDPLANAPPGAETLFSLPEIAALVEPLLGLQAPRDGQGRVLEVRPKGHWFEFEVARRLGYHYPPGSGLFPDIRNQLLEIKHHVGKAVTIDFGHHHPGSTEVIEGWWNQKGQVRARDIRYLIALAPPPDFVITVLVLSTGAEIDSIFGVSPKQTVKYQLGISPRWREEHKGQIIVSGEPFHLE
jgi:hypothetical protein